MPESEACSEHRALSYFASRFGDAFLRLVPRFERNLSRLRNDAAEVGDG
jgi:hypothetical protein